MKNTFNWSRKNNSFTPSEYQGFCIKCSKWLYSRFYYIFLTIHQFYQKIMYLVPSKLFPYIVIFGSIIHNSLTFASSLKPFLPKEILLDIAILFYILSVIFISSDIFSYQLFPYSLNIKNFLRIISISICNNNSNQ